MYCSVLKAFEYTLNCAYSVNDGKVMRGSKLSALTYERCFDPIKVVMITEVFSTSSQYLLTK